MAGKSKDKKGAWYPGYPERYGEGYKIEGIEDVNEKGVTIFYSGVDVDDKKGLVTKGGRILHIVASSRSSLSEAVDKAYRNIEKIKFVDHNNNNANCVRYRKTIGRD
jgi:phosphoribosylamine-glycine ligase